MNHQPMILALLAAHVCPIPRAAYHMDKLSRREVRLLNRYAMCVCGPDGTNDAPEVLDRKGRWVFSPSYACERSGWNGHRYSTREGL